MKRRQFLGSIGVAGTTIALSGCTRVYPLKSLHGLFPLDSNYEKIKQKLYEYADQSNIYLNTVLGSVQIIGDKQKLEKIASKLPLQDYKIYSRLNFMPNPQRSNKIKPASRINSVEMLSEKSMGSNIKVGMIDTFANWNKWYPHNIHHLNLSNNNKHQDDHGSLTAKVLFHPDHYINSKSQTIRGLTPKSKIYHAQIPTNLTHAQLFRDLSESLQWMYENNIEIIEIPLKTKGGDYEIISKLLKRFVEEISNSIIVVSAGNVDVCTGKPNSLADVNSKNVIGVGAIDITDNSIQGRAEMVDIFASSGYNVFESTSYTGTSSSSTLISGILSLYLSLLKKENPNLSPKEYRKQILNGLFKGADIYKITRCDKQIRSKIVNPIEGMDVILSRD